MLGLTPAVMASENDEEGAKVSKRASHLTSPNPKIVRAHPFFHASRKGCVPRQTEFIGLAR